MEPIQKASIVDLLVLYCITAQYQLYVIFLNFIGIQHRVNRVKEQI